MMMMMMMMMMILIMMMIIIIITIITTMTTEMIVSRTTTMKMTTTMLLQVDGYYEKFLRTLKTEGLLNNTLLVFLSDHGLRAGTPEFIYSHVGKSVRERVGVVGERERE